RANGNTVAVFVGLLYACLSIGLAFNVPLEINRRLESTGNSAPSVDIAEAIAFNERASKNEYTQHMPFKECVDDPESRRMRGGFKNSRKHFECVWRRKNVTGSVEILVLGNSIAQIATTLLKSIIDQNFPQVSLMRLVSMPACHPLEYVYHTCPSFHNAIPKLMQAMKPEITFVIYDK
ncbi:hypothetical protein PMAYCL1PPCAC_13497, partial [Pristionchus mayeri]